MSLNCIQEGSLRSRVIGWLSVAIGIKSFITSFMVLINVKDKTNIFLGAGVYE
jgi:hypothetical protein